MDCTDIFKGGNSPDEENPVFQMVVCALTEEAIDAYKGSGEGDKVDVTLTLNGHELDVRYAFQSLFDAFDNAVAQKAKSLVRERFRDVNDLLYDLENRINPEIESRLEEWEKENER